MMFLCWLFAALCPFVWPIFINDKMPECMESLDVNHEALFNSYYGRLEGINWTVGRPEAQYHVNLALGVAYAYNAIGEFRFRKPLTVPSFGLLSTKRFEKSCVPNQFYPDATDWNEDCLFLNIFMPDKQYKPATGFPVLFLVHGGAFNYGTSSDLPLSPLITLYVQRGIAVVTANYRLGPYGWFHFGEESPANNVGLWDLQKAFEFALLSSDQLNLDPKKFTLGGVEAGAILSELLAFRPEVRSNISGLLLISGGSALSPWAISDDVHNRSIDLARELGVQFEDSKELLFGIKMTPMAVIARARAAQPMSRNTRNFVQFTPAFDKDFFHEDDFKHLMYNAQPIPIFAITTSNEGLIRSTSYSKKYTRVFNEFTGLTKKQQKSFNCSDLNKFLEHIFPQPQQLADLRQHYKCADSRGHAFSLYNQFLGDFWFTVPQAFSYLLYAELDHPVYVSVVETNDVNFQALTGSPVMPTPVLFDACLMSTSNPLDPVPDAESIQAFEAIQTKTVDDIVAFVKHGKLGWTPINATSYKSLTVPHKKVTVGNVTVQNDDGFFDKKLAFWRRFLRKHGFDALSPLLPSGEDIFTFRFNE